MEPAKPTTPSGESSAIPDFELPDDPGFISRPPQVSLDDMYRMSLQIRDWFPNGLKTPEERWAEKVDVPFEIE